MTRPRLNRLFAADGRCFDVAIDHGLFGEARLLTGIEQMRSAVDAVVDAAPDAVQLAPGQASLLQDRPGRKPALVLRADVTNVYAPEIDRPGLRFFGDMLPRAVDRAVALDAACVVVNVLVLPDQPDLYRDAIRNVGLARAACDAVGMPLMVEPLVMRPGPGGFAVDGTADRIVAYVRQAVELGADVVKADPTDDLSEYPRVLEAAGDVPVLVRGGSKAADEEILARTEQLIALGAAGIVYGRNVIQHARPAAMTRALMAIVHEGASAAAAMELLRG